MPELIIGPQFGVVKYELLLCGRITSDARTNIGVLQGTRRTDVYPSLFPHRYGLTIR
mgnify:CR=1 FL=1